MVSTSGSVAASSTYESLGGAGSGAFESYLKKRDKYIKILKIVAQKLSKIYEQKTYVYDDFFFGQNSHLPDHSLLFRCLLVCCNFRVKKGWGKELFKMRTVFDF